MKRSKRIAWWSAYAVGSAAVLAGLAWTTARVRTLEREEARARWENDRQETLRLALWRMDSWLTALLAREAARAWYEYESYYPQTIAFNRLLEPIAEGEVVLPSPLLSFSSEWLPLHFQWRPETGFTSPQVPGEMSEAMVACGPIDPTPGCAERLAKLAGRANGPRILALLDEAGEAPAELGLEASDRGDQRLGKESAPAESKLTSAAEIPQQAEGLWAANSQVLRSHDPHDYRGRAAAKNFAQQAVADENVAPPGSAGSSQRQTAQIATMDARETMVPVRPAVPSIGPLTALRIDEESDLVLARRVALGDRTFVQGVLIDWPAMRAALLVQVADLVPGSSLEPVDDPNEPLRLAALPVRFVPPPEAPLQHVAHPATPGLALVWVAALGAIAATGLALRASIGAAVRTSRFASSVTHELRTPLTTFRLYSEMLADGVVRDPDRMQEYFVTLRDESARLGLLVENVLAWSRAENGRAPAEPRAITIGSLIEEVTPMLRRRAEEANAVFSVVSAAPAEERLLTDPVRVRQILFNLVDNACKYAGAGSHVALRVERRPEGILFAVEDDGPGVPASLRGRIFRAFDRGTRGPGDAVRGLGLGLAISHELALGLGARLRCADDVEAGARFELELPA